MRVCKVFHLNLMRLLVGERMGVGLVVMNGVVVQGVDFMLVSFFFRSFGGIGVDGQFVLPDWTWVGAGIFCFILLLFLFMFRGAIRNRLDSWFVFLDTAMELVILISLNFLLISERT